MIELDRDTIADDTLRASLGTKGRRFKPGSDWDFICGPMDVCYCTPRCEGAGSARPKAKRPAPQKMLGKLRDTGVSTVVVEDTIGFLGKEGYSYRERGPINPDGDDAAWLIERLLLYVEHDRSCAANDLDPLDDTPCTCGLRPIMRGEVERAALATEGK